MAKQEKETLEANDDRSIEKEILAFIQIVNGLNEVYDDDAKFERVYKYIEMRYAEKAKAKREEARNTLLMFAFEKQSRFETALEQIRKVAESESPDGKQIVALIDDCLLEIKDICTRKVSDLNVYKEAKRQAS